MHSSMVKEAFVTFREKGCAVVVGEGAKLNLACWCGLRYCASVFQRNENLHLRNFHRW